MLKAVDVNLDTDEMVLKLEKQDEQTRVNYNKLDRLVIGKQPVRKLLRTVEVKVIEVHVRGSEGPYTIGSNHVRDFDHVEAYLRRMAEKYDIEVIPNSQEPD